MLVAAPTGTGKTVVAEFAVHNALSRGLRAFYTTPIKALSNQKFRDFRARYGDQVGLLTGDLVENLSGVVLVMTTEVARNMLVQDPELLPDVGCLVFDEVHYLADPERGTAWEESILLAPAHVPLVCLSATVANAGGDRGVAPHHRAGRGADRVLPESGAPQAALLRGRAAYPDPGGRRAAVPPARGGHPNRQGRHRGSHAWGSARRQVPARRRDEARHPADVVQAPWPEADLLPAIYFLFSRKKRGGGGQELREAATSFSPLTPRRFAAIARERLASLRPRTGPWSQVERLLAAPAEGHRLPPRRASSRRSRRWWRSCWPTES